VIARPIAQPTLVPVSEAKKPRQKPARGGLSIRVGVVMLRTIAAVTPLVQP